MRTVTTSVSVVWRPARYAAKWAHVPSEVPQFDPSRGGDPFLSPPVEFADGVWVWPHGGKSLGGTKPPPSPVYILTTEYFDPDHRAETVTSIEVSNYPRLVRQSHADVGEKLGGNHPLEEIAGLMRSLEDIETFMVDAQAAMARFGPLAYGEFDFTLTAWRHTTLELHTHLLLLRQIGLIKEVEGGSEEALRLDDAHREPLLVAIDQLDPALALPAPTGLAHLVRTSTTLGELRTGLSAAYWLEFRRNTMAYAHVDAFFRGTERPSWDQPQLAAVGFGPGQIVVRCGCRGWAFYELWQRATRGAKIHLCDGCGLLFEAQRKDARHWQDACRVKSHRRRKRNAS